MKILIISICLLCNTLVSIGQNIIQAEYFIDSDAGFGKNRLLRIKATDKGKFTFTAKLDGVTPGYHSLYIRTKNSNGIWSLTNKSTIEVLASAGLRKVVAGEYAIDTDPGFGSGTPISVAPKDSTIAEKDSVITAGLSPGFHTVFYRFKDNNGIWGITTTHNVEVVKSIDTSYVVLVEYFVGSDPGFGNCSYSKISPSFKNGTFSFKIPSQQLHNGTDTIYFRVLDSSNYNWSLTQWKAVTVSGASAAKGLLVEKNASQATSSHKTDALSVAVNPNPVKSNTASVSISNYKRKEIQLNIFSSVGSKVLSQKIYTTFNKADRSIININNLQSGTYIIQVIDGNSIATCKMIRQ